MKSPKKSKSSAPNPADNQLTLDYLLDTLDNLIEVAEKQTIRIDLLSERLDSLGALRPIEFKKPELKWFEQAPQLIEWCVCCDPARLMLMPGTTLRYNIEDAVITTYDGVTIGELNSLGHGIICKAIKQGDKLHVYLTTARKLGIKLGRPQ